MQEISIIKLNKADKPYQILLLKDENSAQIFKIQLDKNMILDKEITKFENVDQMETVLKKKLEIKGTVPNEIKSWCSQNEILKSRQPLNTDQDEASENL